MSTLRDDVLPVIDEGWTLVDELGFAPFVVKLRTRTWSSGKVLLGTTTDVDLTLEPSPQVKPRGQSGGRTPDLLVGPITPKHADGGYTVAQLNPTVGGGVESFWVVTGPSGTFDYTLLEIDSSDPLGYTLTLRPLQRSTPF